VRNDLYWGEAPYYDVLIDKFYAQESSMYTDLQAGNLDACYLTDTTYINNVKDDKVTGVKIYTQDRASIYGLSLAGAEDSGTGPLHDINVRQAVAHAVDVNTIVNTLGEGVYKTATSILPEESWAYLDTGSYAYDPELAKEYLAKSGYGVDNPVNLVMAAEDTAWNKALSETIQQYLAEVGINLDLTNVAPFETILPLLLEGGMDLSLNGPYDGAGVDPANSLSMLAPEEANKLVRLYQADLIDDFMIGKESKDREERIDAYHKLQQGLFDQVHFIPMWQETVAYAYSEKHASMATAVDLSNYINPLLLTD
jgi:peptide/nickel transport system substrate-binding protein